LHTTFGAPLLPIKSVTETHMINGWYQFLEIGDVTLASDHAAATIRSEVTGKCSDNVSQKGMLWANLQSLVELKSHFLSIAPVGPVKM
jgi:hypothetical protein